MTRNEAEEILKEHGQEHVLRHFDDLSAEAQEGLLTQISEVNWDDLALAGVQERFLRSVPWILMRSMRAVQSSRKQVMRQSGQARLQRFYWQAVWERVWGWTSQRAS